MNDIFKPHPVPANAPRKGALVLNGGWPAIVLDGYTKRPTRLCYVFGLHAEIGSCYASDLGSEISVEEFRNLALENQGPTWSEADLESALKRYYKAVPA